MVPTESLFEKIPRQGEGRACWLSVGRFSESNALVPRALEGIDCALVDLAVDRSIRVPTLQGNKKSFSSVTNSAANAATSRGRSGHWCSTRPHRNFHYLTGSNAL